VEHSTDYQLCPVLPPPSSSSCTWNLLFPFLSPDLFFYMFFGRPLFLWLCSVHCIGWTLTINTVIYYITRSVRGCTSWTHVSCTIRSFTVIKTPKIYLTPKSVAFQQCTLHNHNEQFFQVGLLDRGLISLGLALSPPSTSVSSDFMVLCKCLKKLYLLHFTL